jgi:hypothetical protein
MPTYENRMPTATVRYSSFYCSPDQGAVTCAATKITFMYSFSGVRDLSPNFHIHVSQDRSTYFLQHRQINITRSQTYEVGNCDCGAQYLFWNICFEFSVLVLCMKDLPLPTVRDSVDVGVFVYILVIQQQQQLGLSEARS